MRFLAALTVLIIAAASLPAQATDRDSAFALFKAGKRVEAVPLLERAVASGSADKWVYEQLGFMLTETAAALPDAGARKQQRARAHAMFEKAIALGSTDAQLQAMARSVPADGGNDVVFSERAEVDAAMQRAEAAFGGHDFRTALAEYQHAFALDSMQYSAALFSGDSYLNLQIIDSAYIWYARATVINPDREVAWRYWSDVLLKHNQKNDARDKAIQAIVAEPFNNVTRGALGAWARSVNVAVGFPPVNMPPRDTATVKPPYRVAYDSVRLLWRTSDGKPGPHFVAHFTADSSYRHSLAEEKEALQAAYLVGDDVNTGNLRKMDDAGMLDAYIFYARADAGIAKDYAAYRLGHRDVLVRFWSDVAVRPRG